MADIHSVKLKKTQREIQYSFDGVRWETYFDGSEEDVNTTWMMMQAGFCNDDLFAMIRKYNQSSCADTMNGGHNNEGQ